MSLFIFDIRGHTLTTADTLITYTQTQSSRGYTLHWYCPNTIFQGGSNDFSSSWDTLKRPHDDDRWEPETSKNSPGNIGEYPPAVGAQSQHPVKTTCSNEKYSPQIWENLSLRWQISLSKVVKATFVTSFEPAATENNKCGEDLVANRKVLETFPKIFFVVQMLHKYKYVQLSEWLSNKLPDLLEMLFATKNSGNL